VTDLQVHPKWKEEKHLNRRCRVCFKDTSNSIKAGICGDCENKLYFKHKAVKPTDILIKKKIDPWVAKFVVRTITYLLKEDKYIEPNTYLDKPIGGHEKKDIFKANMKDRFN